MKLIVYILILVFITMQFIIPQKIEYIEDTTFEIQTSENIKLILKKACYDCHSNQINYPWYSNIAPFSWVVINHTTEGVRALNFSKWEKYSDIKKEEKLKAIYRTVYSAMPLPSYTLAHTEANIIKEEREIIRNWTGVR